MPKPVVPEDRRRPRRPTRSGTVLSEGLIVETALRMLREHGSTGFTGCRLGLALDVDGGDATPCARSRSVALA